MFKQIFTLIVMFLLLIGSYSYSQDVKVKDFEIIPYTGNNKNALTGIINKIGNHTDGVITGYREEAKKIKDLGTARATGVFNWNLILLYIKYLIKFLSQVGMVIGAVMIIYAGYLYASAVFSGSNPQKGATAVKNAILGVLIIIFSYSILKILTSMFL